MADFILVEPSTDIHLVLDPGFRNTANQALNNLPLKIWVARRWQEGGGYTYTDITANCAFDLFPANQPTVSIAGSVLTPLVKGTAFMQIRVTDPDIAALYHYTVARIMVHDKMDTWWFGNENFSVFHHPIFAHGQPSLYASFDNGDVIGDITGHEYVTLTSGNPETCQVVTDPDHPWKGRVKGGVPGQTQLTGTLMGKTLALPVSVPVFDVRDNKILKPLQVNKTVSPKQTFNMLFIAEGFNDEKKFEEICRTTVQELFSSLRHSPYNLLKDDFNVWMAFEPSVDEGITTASQVTQDGFPMPLFGPENPDEINGFFTAKKLLELIGPSTQTSAARGITPQNYHTNMPAAIQALIVTWSADPVAVALGFDAAKVPVNYPENAAVKDWMDQVPMNAIPQAKNSYYGFAAGNRPGEKQSKVVSRVDEGRFIPGNAAFDINQFTKRIREWYIPNQHNLSFPPALDNRRWAPELYVLEDNIDAPWIRYFIEDHIAEFNEASTTPIDHSFRIGTYWDKKVIPDPATRGYSSAGLVCFIINSALNGRSDNAVGNFIGAIVGKWSSHKQTDKGLTNHAALREVILPDRTHKLFLEPTIEIDRKDFLGMIAHEFAHSFALGDEYEDTRAAATRQHVHRFDNLTHHIDIFRPGAADTHFAKAIDPAKIPWSVLHRIQYALTITKSVTITDKNSVTLSILPSDMNNLVKILNDHSTVYLHKLVSGFENQNNRLLRFSAADTFNKDIFTELSIESELNETTYEVTLKITPQSHPSEFPITGPEDHLIPAGSYIYVPQKDEFGQPFSLIEKEVMSFMKNTSYGGNAGNGRALRENFDETTTWAGVYQPANLDPLNENTNNTDYPPDIPDYKGPCKKYRMIGVYEGGGRFIGDAYRPAGACKMRDPSNNKKKKDEEKEFCFVCKYLIVSRVNPSKLAMLDKEYPERKSIKWKKFIDGLGMANNDIPAI